jgi:hypothetical protein
MTHFVNVYQMPNGRMQWLGKAIESKSLSDELAFRGHAIYRLRVKLKGSV